MTTATQHKRPTPREQLNSALHTYAFCLFGADYEVFFNSQFNDYWRVENKGKRICEGGLKYCVDILSILYDDQRNPSPLPF